MKKKKNTLFAVLTVLIIAAGFAGMDSVKLFLPYLKKEVTPYTLEQAQNPVLYVDGRQELTLYPWNYYDESTCLPLEDSMPGGSFDSYIRYSSQELASNDEKQSVSSMVAEYIYFMEEKELLSPASNFSQYIRLDLAKMIFYLKNMEFTGSDGAGYVLNMAFTKSNVLYYHLVPKSAAPVAEQKIEQEKERLDKYLEDARKVPAAVRQTPASPPAEKTENPILDFYDKMYYKNLFGMDYYLGTVLKERKSSYFEYQKELLVVFPANSGILSRTQKARNPTILFYDPATRTVSGFSTEP